MDLEEIRVVSPRYPEETPYWPCALFLHEEEIVAALWFEDAETAIGYAAEDQGVISETPEESTEGWYLHLLIDEETDPQDPRGRVPAVEWVSDSSPSEAMQAAYGVIEDRGAPLGRSYEDSLARLVWRRVEED